MTQVTAGRKKRILTWPVNHMKEEDEEELGKCLVGEQEWEPGCGTKCSVSCNSVTIVRLSLLTLKQSM